MQTAPENLQVEMRLEWRMEVKDLAAPTVLVLGGRPTVPHTPTCPVEELRLANGQCSRSVTEESGRVETYRQSVPDANHVLKVVLKPIVQPLTRLLRHQVADMAWAVAFHRELRRR